MSLKNYAQVALDIQHKYNIKEIVLAWLDVAASVTQLGIINLNNHPISILFSGKVNKLTGGLPIELPSTVHEIPFRNLLSCWAISLRFLQSTDCKSADYQSAIEIINQNNSTYAKIFAQLTGSNDKTIFDNAMEECKKLAAD